MLQELKLERPVLIACLLVLATLAVYLPVGGLSFIYFDDPAYVFENPRVQGGLTWSGVVWAFTRFHASNWHPLTWISHMLDCQIFGLKAGGHHLTNLIIHCANTVLVFALLRRLTRATWRSALVAGLFALHPLHVESVAWVAERKDVLSTFFGVLCLVAYTRYTGLRDQTPQSADSSTARGTSRYYGLTLTLFVLSLMSKPMLITLPCVMLLLDWWPLRRFGSAHPHNEPGRILSLLREKLPFVALSGCSSVITFMAQKAGGAVAPLQQLPPDARISNAIVSYIRYIGKLFWPSDLAVLYPYRAWSFLIVALALGALAGFSLWTFKQRGRRPYLLVGWLWYVGTLLPVIGIVQVGAQSIADRYTYLPSIGLFILFAWAGAEVLALRKRAQWAGFAVGSGTLIALAVAAQPQVVRWQNTETLFRHTVAVTHRNALAYNTLGRYFGALHEWKDAERCYRTAVNFDPGFMHGWNNLGCALIDQGRADEAITNCQFAVRLNRSFAEAHNNLATALLNSGKPQAATLEYAEALRLRPDYEEAHYNFGNALAALGKIPEARQHYQAAIELNPRSANAHNNYGFVLLKEKEFSLASAEFRATLALDPRLWQAYYGLGHALAGQGQYAAAEAQFFELLSQRPYDVATRFQVGICQELQGKIREAIHTFTALVERSPEHPGAHLHLGRALDKSGRRPDAIRQYRRALEVSADYPDALNALAWILATDPQDNLRNGAEAVTLAKRACDLTRNGQPLILATLGAAQAEAGAFQEAIAATESAQAKAKLAGDLELIQKCEKLLAAFASGRSYREPAPQPGTNHPEDYNPALNRAAAR